MGQTATPTGTEDDDACPTPTAHKRLEEVHRFWHGCLEGYQNPEEFRVNLNATIQAARNLTFALQAEKARIHDFDAWYATWRDTMKADPLMGWLNASRVRIVHIGDLETNSVAVARVSMDYYDAAREVADSMEAQPAPAETRVEPVSPTLAIDEILERISQLDLPDALLADATISIERRWEDKELPGVELLEALAHVFGLLSQIIEDAHERVGRATPTVEHLSGDALIEAEPIPDGRLPCMVTSRARRTASFQVRAGAVATGGRLWSMRPGVPSLAASVKKYKFEPTKSDFDPANPTQDITSLLPHFEERALAILRSGEEHGWFIFLFRRGVPVRFLTLEARNAMEKRSLSQQVADIVAVNRIDGVVQVGEVWSAILRPGSGFIRAADHPDRTEAVAIHIEAATGETANALIPFVRRKGRPKKRRVQIGEIVRDEDSEVTNNFLLPTRTVWEALGMRKKVFAPGSSFFRPPT